MIFSLHVEQSVEEILGSHFLYSSTPLHQLPVASYFFFPNIWGCHHKETTRAEEAAQVDFNRWELDGLHRGGKN